MNKVLVSLLLTLGITGAAQAAGDAAAGQNKVMLCTACHSADGNSAAPNFPKLAGQGERYLLKQMKDIKAGSTPGAAEGVGRKVLEMTAMLDAFSDQDLADIAAYYASQTGSIGAADPALVERGEALWRGGQPAEGLPSCTGCHAPGGSGAAPAVVVSGVALWRGCKLAEGMPSRTGCHAPDGSGNAGAASPKLNGQHAAYIAKQLTDFREAARTNDGDAMTMRTIAAKLSNKDIEALSSYIQGLH